MSTTYERFLGLTREIGRLTAVQALLEWDQETYMPPKGDKPRAEQYALLAGLIHERLVSFEIAELLERVDSDPPGDVPEHVVSTNVREMRRRHQRAKAVPRQLVEEIARTTTLARPVWVKARQESRFAGFAPWLDKLLGLRRQVADLIGYQGERFDALLDEFEPGACAADIEKVFNEVRRRLVPFVQAIVEAPRKPDRSIVHRSFQRQAQERFGRSIVEAMGFDMHAGRIDVSTHPFCTSFSPLDVRITTRYDNGFLSPALFGLMHEAGHGLYEQGRDPEHEATPMGDSVSLGIHESQSRLWENIVGRGLPFWKHYYPALQRAFPAALAGVTLEDFHAAANTVEPSYVRVEADEVTYNLHVILRFELERALLDQKIDVADAPEAWNAKVTELFGLPAPDDANGCLQDIHWSMGAFGYFPTYALGNLYAAQFYAAAEKAIPDLSGRIARGDLRTLGDWLRENIYRHGQRFRANELVQRVTGKPLSPEPFFEYIHGKFKPIYGL